jgi:alpha-glucuronidase
MGFYGQHGKRTRTASCSLGRKMGFAMPLAAKPLESQMKHKYLYAFIFLVFCRVLFANDGYDLWLKYKKIDDPQRLKEYKQKLYNYHVTGSSPTRNAIRFELKKGLESLLSDNNNSELFYTAAGSLVIGTPDELCLVKDWHCDTSLGSLGNEGYIIKSIEMYGMKSILITANQDIGLLYGTFHFLRLLQTQQDINDLNIISKPKIQYRIIDHWDNLDGTIERGYAGKSLWKWDELPEKIDSRYRDYARADASIGINGAVLNNVNASSKILSADYLRKVAALADVFRPYGVKVYLSVNFASPISPKFRTGSSRDGGIGDLNTADPLNPEVRKWWKDKAKEIYRIIPDFGGFLVKANSEGMPGPQDYGRTHADGANMLAEALAPHNGIVMWRAFVYNADVDPDRAKRAYLEFVPFDGKFSSNVFVQAKNGAIDFQPREPVQPLFGAMPKTPLMLELQITQEYLGHSTHLVYLAPMWKEYLEFDTFVKGKGSTLASIIDGTVDNYQMTGIAGVANTGDCPNWCGHFFAQANWFAFGRLAWDHTLTSEQIADDWIRMSLGNDDKTVTTVKSMMIGSWEACINYMTPLGLHHIMQADFHYGPQPQYSKASRADWNSVYYHRADANGLGFDRSVTGSNAAGQYSPHWREIFNDINTCPEKYLLWFHHVPWDHKMKSGKTLWQELCHRYYMGTDYVNDMYDKWQGLESQIDPEIFVHVKNKLEKQKKDSVIWRDTCLDYFKTFSGKDVK